ncbi:FadR/GntR family transcriptional regulator [Micromonospora sp. NPDC005305]|uniref:FadR/GntR family transcriptional regulator n=1 Tax=Micromonospora sp. NPDC005305 TaxID=3156875 RepID=UPI0033A1530F
MSDTERLVVRSKLSDTVAAKLESLIVAGQLEVGAKLPNEKDLAQQFGVGRSSMREAVRTLEAAGFLRSSHGVGVFVVSNSPRRMGPVDQSLMGGFTMSDLFETRMAIEAKAAELAAQRLTDHHSEVLHSIIAAASAPGITEHDFVALDARLHRQVAEASGNPLLLYMWESISPQFAEYSHKVIGLPSRLERAHADHCGIVDAITARDPELAARQAHEHVAAVQRELQSLTSIERWRPEPRPTPVSSTGAGEGR